MNSVSKLLAGRWVTIVVALVFFSLWEVVSRWGVVSPVLLSSPLRIGRALPSLLSQGSLIEDLGFSSRVFGASLALATVVGTLVGLAMGRSPLAYRVLSPFIISVNALPKIVLMPLIVLWLGIGFGANLFLGTLMASFPVVVSTYSGVRSLDRELLLVARAFHAGRWMTLRSVILPGILPHLLGGLRVGVNYAMVGVLVSEFFASSRGVGYRMMLYMSNFEIDAFFVCLVLVAAFSLLCSGVLHWLSLRFQAWRPDAFAPAARP